MQTKLGPDNSVLVYDFVRTVFPMANPSKLKPEPEFQYERKQRKCLGCGKIFPSEHVGERICQKCKLTDNWRWMDQAV
jgi:ribosomal protein S27AE